MALTHLAKHPGNQVTLHKGLARSQALTQLLVACITVKRTASDRKLDVGLTKVPISSNW